MSSGACADSSRPATRTAPDGFEPSTARRRPRGSPTPTARVLVLANKCDVAGALAAGEVGDALDLDQLRAEMGAAGVRVIGCEACSAVDGSGIERALEGALRRGR